MPKSDEQQVRNSAGSRSGASLFQPGGKLEVLQAGRGIAALLVLLFHAAGSIFAGPEFWHQEVDDGLLRFGHEGVAFFFVLSGFIILHAHARDLGRPEAFGDYLFKRATRVYLPYWVVLFPLIAVNLIIPGKPELSAPSVMLNSPLLVGLTNHATLAVAWTLFNEIGFYALFAIAILSRRVGLTVLLLWQTCCFAALFTGRPVHYLLGPINLLFGMGLATRWALPRWIVPAPRWLMAGGIVGFAALGLMLDYTRWIDPAVSSIPFGLASTMFVLGGISAEQRMRVRVPAVLRMLGDISFSLYLTHYPALSVLARLFMKIGPLRSLPAQLSFASIVVTCLAIAAMFHLCVEKPLLRHVTNHRRRRLDRHTDALAH